MKGSLTPAGSSHWFRFQNGNFVSDTGSCGFKEQHTSLQLPFLPNGKLWLEQFGKFAWMEELIKYILQFGSLNQQQIDFLASKSQTIKLVKNEYLSEAGRVPKYVGFVLSGVFRFCYYNNKGEEITNFFVDENNFVTDYPRFELQAAASEYVQAVTDCTLLVFSKKAWEDISNTIVGWDAIASKIERKCLMNSIEKRSPLVSEDATTRYLSFIEQFPNLVNRIPLSYVASYLGITQQSLSRIRKNIQ
jgi:CRP-like cAMP-binding protein